VGVRISGVAKWRKALEDRFSTLQGSLSTYFFALLQQACPLQQDVPLQQVFAALKAFAVKANIKATPARAVLSRFILTPF
jgi:hypothetical protein